MNVHVHKLWKDFASSYDAPSASVRSSPNVILLALAGFNGGVLALGYIPALAHLSQFRMPWLPVVVSTLAAACSYVAWKHNATGTIGTACMLLDTMLYSLALSLAAGFTRGPMATGFCLLLALFLAMFPAHVYSLTWLIGIAMCLPPVLIAAFVATDPLVIFLLLASCLIGLVISRRTSQQRNLEQQNQMLRFAVTEADKIAEQTMEIALASSLVDVGHLLHELRNLRACQNVNLHFLRQCCADLPELNQAINETIDTQNRQEALIENTLERIRKMAHPARETFVLQDVVDQFVNKINNGLSLALITSEPKATLRGNRQHIEAILNNLLRNAHQAGATSAKLTIAPLPGAAGVCLAVHDNGPGMNETQMAELFRPFGHTTRAHGSGLGLYLTRRYVHLLGGTIEANNAEQGGVVFRMNFPVQRLDHDKPSPLHNVEE